MRRLGWILALAAAVLPPAAARGQMGDELVPGLSPPPGALEKFSARVVTSGQTVRPGDSLYVAVEMTVAEKFWIYGPVAGGKIVVAQDLTIEAGQTAVTVGEVLFSATRRHVSRFPDGTSDTHNVYEGKGYAYVPVTVPAGLAPGGYQLPLTVEGQVCAPDVCLQLKTVVTAQIQVGATTVVSPAWTGPIRAALAEARTARQWRTELAGQGGREEVEVFGRGGGWVNVGLAGGLALALVAGLLLNVMPCVLPIIPLRLLALLNQAKESRRRFITLGLAFAVGIVLFFVAIAAVNVGLKLTLQYRLKWGDMFRHPELVIALALLLVALAVNMFGVFELVVPGKVAEAEGRQGHLGAAAMGFLVAVLATPCSGAVLAAAFGWAQLKPLWIGTASLVVMGVGMALPHAVLAFFPKAVSRIPRAGRWTALFKQFVGFVLLFIAVWLLGTQLSQPHLASVMIYAVILAMCLWMWGAWVGGETSAGRKWSVRACAAVLAVAGGLVLLRPPAPPVLKMRPFDAAEVAAARAADRTVLVKFTAAWCWKCKVVDMNVYDKPEVAEVLAERGVLAIRADVTRRGMPGEKMLYEQLGESGLPVTAIFPPGGRPAILLRGGFSKADLFDALAAAQGGP